MESNNEYSTDDFLNNEMKTLRLLSVNAASKILGIRYETVKSLVRTGKIKSVTTTNHKFKIPYKSLLEYVNGNSTSAVSDNGIISLKEKYQWSKIIHTDIT